MYQSFLIIITLFLAMHCCAASSNQNDPFYNNLIASPERAHYLKQCLPNHNFFKDLDAYLTFLSNVTGLGVVHDGSDKVRVDMLKRFGNKIISDQFDPMVCTRLLELQMSSDDVSGYPLDGFALSLFTTAVPEALSMGLDRLQGVYLERKEQKALVLFAKHMRKILVMLHPKHQFILWRDSIKDNPVFFDEYIEHSKLIKRVNPNLKRLHEKMHDALEHSLLLECQMEELVYEIVSASISQS